MKKLLLTTAMTLTAALVFGQGQVNFNNTSTAWSPADSSHLLRFSDTGPFAIPNGTLVTSNVVAGLGLLRVQLYYANSTTTTPGSFTPVVGNPATFRGTTSASPGAWIGGGTRTLTGIPNGTAANLLIIAWDSAYAADGLAALAGLGTTYGLPAGGGLFGMSSIFSYTPPTSPTPAPTEFLMNNMGTFDIHFVGIPEPSTFALAGLGAAALLIFRRRK